MANKDYFQSTLCDCKSKRGATLTMVISLSNLDRFAKFFHLCKEH